MIGAIRHGQEKPRKERRQRHGFTDEYNADATGPVTLAALRANLRIRNALYECLAALTAAGAPVRSPEGYRVGAR